MPFCRGVHLCPLCIDWDVQAAHSCYIQACLAAGQAAFLASMCFTSAAPCRGKDGGGRILCSHFLQELCVHVSPLLSLCALDGGCMNVYLSLRLLSLL